MKIITLQMEIKADSIGWLVTERIPSNIRIKEIQLPAEISVEGGWTEVRIKLLRGPDVSSEALLRMEHITKEVLGADKVYLENVPLVLKCDYGIIGISYCVVFEVKNGTEIDRIYTAQIIYE
jgi:hypothetical protein